MNRDPEVDPLAGLEPLPSWGAVAFGLLAIVTLAFALIVLAPVGLFMAGVNKIIEWSKRDG